jgi:aminopeptidase YwaD
MVKQYVIVLLSAFFAITINAQITQIKEHAKALCSEAFHGRGYVNSGDSIAAAFIQSSFQKNGIASINGNYLQPFFFNVNTFPGSMEVNHNDRTLRPGVHFMVHPSSRGGEKKLVPKKISTTELLDKKTLLSITDSLSNDSIYNSIILDFTKVSADTIKLLQPIAEQLCASFPIVEITNKKFTWSVAAFDFNHPYIQLQDSVFNENSDFQIVIDSKLIKKHRANNVIGYVPAKKKSDEFIVFAAHYDHLGQMGDSTYFPGANDNASGTALLMEMANKIKQKPLKINAVFIAFAGEEAGLIGSNYYVNNPSIDLKKVRFVINTDIMGSGEEGVTVVNATLHDKEFQILKNINKKKSYLKEIKSRGPAANSDHYWFTQKGVPSFFLYTMGPNKNYHDIFDTYENLSFSATENVFYLLYDFAKKLTK